MHKSQAFGSLRRRGSEVELIDYTQGKKPRIPKDSIELAAKVKNPIESSDEVLKEAKVLYERYCIHCHGEKGMGDGLVGQVYKGVTAYNSRAVKDRSEGHIFHVITHGKGRMWGHGSQISIEDRWKIVKYVQTLQKQ